MTKLMLAGLALLAVMVVILPYVGCDTNAGGRTISSGEVGGNIDKPGDIGEGGGNIDKPGDIGEGGDVPPDDPNGDEENNNTDGDSVNTVNKAESITVTIMDVDNKELSVTLEDSDSDGSYEISTADKLYAFAAAVNGGKTTINGELTANIVVNEKVLDEEGKLSSSSSNFRLWTPIGTKDYKYTGIFDGADYTISGLYFNDNTQSYVGLFGYIGDEYSTDSTKEVTIQNLGVLNSYFCGDSYVGGVVGRGDDEVKVTNCYNTGAVSGTGGYVGGVVGLGGNHNNGYNAKVTNCYNTGIISGTADVGGVVGRGDATDCHNTGAVSGARGSGGSMVVGYGGSVGGVVGWGDASDCYNTGAVSGTGSSVGGVVGLGDASNCNNKGTINGKEEVGGVVGKGDASNCYNTGVVSSTDTASASSYDNHSYAGGVVGKGSASDCHNTGAVSGTGDYVGGVVGDGHASQCYNTGTISGRVYVGGVVGYRGSANRCYNTGVVNGTGYVGGVVGSCFNTGVRDCYNTGAVSGTGSSVGGVVGYVYTSVITDCYNTGVVNGTDYVGGVVGRSDLDFETEIYSCYYLVGTATGGINGKDSEGAYDTTYAINASDFASENMANLLNGSVGEHWEYISGNSAPTLKVFNKG